MGIQGHNTVRFTLRATAGLSESDQKLRAENDGISHSTASLSACGSEYGGISGIFGANCRLNAGWYMDARLLAGWKAVMEFPSPGMERRALNTTLDRRWGDGKKRGTIFFCFFLTLTNSSWPISPPSIIIISGCESSPPPPHSC